MFLHSKAAEIKWFVSSPKFFQIERARAKIKQEGKNKNKTFLYANTLWIHQNRTISSFGGNTTIYTGKKIKICTFYFSGTIIVIKIEK